jgi:Peptidase A4 family
MIAALPKRTCPAGMVPLTPVSARRTAHGAAVYHYAMSSGPGFDAYVPPAGFRPLAATNATLREMNMPVRPARGQALAQWKSDMRAYTGTDQPAPCLDLATRHSRSARSGHALTAGQVNDHFGSDNWSGYLDNQTAQPFTKVVAHFIQPGMGSCACAAPAETDEVSWVGLGGFAGSSKLLQDGTELLANSPVLTWFEYLGGKTVTEIVTNEVGIGADVAAAVTYTAASKSATFAEVSGGRTLSSVTEPGMDVDYDGSTAEFINERPTHCFPSHCFRPLANYGKMQWSQARVFNSSGVFAAGDSQFFPAGIVMTTDSSLQGAGCGPAVVLSFPEHLAVAANGGETFDSVWCRS